MPWGWEPRPEPPTTDELLPHRPGPATPNGSTTPPPLAAAPIRSGSAAKSPTSTLQPARSSAAWPPAPCPTACCTCPAAPAAPRSARLAPKPTAVTPTRSSRQGSTAAKASPPTSPRIRLSSSPSPRPVRTRAHPRHRSWRQRSCAAAPAARAVICPHGRHLSCPHGTKTPTPASVSRCARTATTTTPAVAWNAHAPELWRRTMIGLRRRLDRLARPSRIKLSYAKVAEFQGTRSHPLPCPVPARRIRPGRTR